MKTVWERLGDKDDKKRMGSSKRGRLIKEGEGSAFGMGIRESDGDETERRRYLTSKLREIAMKEERLKLDAEEADKREKKLAMVIGTLDGRINAVEEREKALELALRKNIENLSLKEQQLDMKAEIFALEVKKAEERILKQFEKEKEELHFFLEEGLKDLGLKKETFWNRVEELTDKVKQVQMVNERQKSGHGSSVKRPRMAENQVKHRKVAAEGRLMVSKTQFQKEKEEFGFFLGENMKKLTLKEELFYNKVGDLTDKLQQVQSVFEKQRILSENSMKRLELAEDKVEVLKVVVERRFMTVESQQNTSFQSLYEVLREAEMIKESAEKKLEEFEKMKQQFDAYQEGVRGLELKKLHLVAMYKDFNGKLIDKEGAVNQLIDTLNLKLINVEGIWKSVQDTCERNRLKETELSTLRDWVEKKMEEADSKQAELKEREKLIMLKEDSLMVKEKHLIMKGMALMTQQRDLERRQGEVDKAKEQNEQMSALLEWREKNLNSVKEFTRKCFLEHRAMKKELVAERKALEKRAFELQHKGMNRNTDDSGAENSMVSMDEETMQMLLDNPNMKVELECILQCPDLLSEEYITTLLTYSSDPAKVVVDAMARLCPPQWPEEDSAMQTCIAFLEQLMKTPRKISPQVREEAAQLASQWKSNMRADSILELLGFLNLLAAYDLAASHFEKNEILGFLRKVPQDKSSPSLWEALGVSELQSDN